MAILNKEQDDIFDILISEVVPQNIIAEVDQISSDKNKDIFDSFYKYENETVNLVFRRFHYQINEWIKKARYRIDKGNRYILSAMFHEMRDFKKIIEQIGSFFIKHNFIFNNAYSELIKEINVFLTNSNDSYFPNEFNLIKPIIDEPVFVLQSRNGFKNIKYLIFGAAKTKPDIRVSDVLDGKLDLLNKDDVLYYDGPMQDSILYLDFDIWWRKNSHKYKWYNPKEQMNAIELKFANYYKKTYKADSFPVLIPQVYIHYDPKDKKSREIYNILTFQRMDFLMIYKGKRVIIEIDGKTHTPENSLREYSLQTEYDRTMRFLGYDVFRLGGYELAHNFEEVVGRFFENLINYLGVK